MIDRISEKHKRVKKKFVSKLVFVLYLWNMQHLIRMKDERNHEFGSEPNETQTTWLPSATDPIDIDQIKRDKGPGKSKNESATTSDDRRIKNIS